MSTNHYPTQPWPGAQPSGRPPRRGQYGPPVPAPPAVDPVAGMRASNADRERTVDVLKSGFAEGRLTPDEYNDRVGAVYRALTYGELSGIVQDLPSGPMPVPYLTQAPALPAAFAAHPVDPFAPPMRIRRTSGLAAAALVLGLAEFPTLGFTAIPALVCGHLARSRIRERGEDGDGMATAGIVLGWIGVAFWVLLLFAGVVSAVSSGPSTGSFLSPPGGG